LLIHPHFLRQKNAGQIDLVILKKSHGEIYEIKGPRGIGKTQRSRLFQSAILLGEMFNRSFLIKTVRFKTNSNSSFDIT
jgi:hypothetical protein